MVEQTLHDDAPSRNDRFETHVLLGAACERGDIEEVRRILADAPELARQDALANNEHQALHYAVKGIYPHREATSPRAIAFDRGHTAIVEAIDAHLETSLGASDAGRDLCEAAGRGDIDQVTAMLDADAALIGARDNRGRTPLHRAVERADLDLATLLLDRDADIGAQDSDGQTPLHRAVDT